jgi:hypothetical protein
MKINIIVTASKNKYGSELASTEMTLDSDQIDTEAVTELAKGMTKSTIERAKAKEREVIPAPVAPPLPEPKESAVF